MFNKPVGISSAGFLNRLKSDLRKEGLLDRNVRVGHGGTLDPFAGGLLVVAFSRESTKKLQEILKGRDKSYCAEIVLGLTSNTYDREGKIVKKDFTRLPGVGEIYRALSVLKGRKEQTPPRFSALKVSGKPAYERAREGEDFELKPRPSEIKEIVLLGIDYFPDKAIVGVLLKVSSGFYVRSFADDLGKELGTGGYLNGLVRYRIGDFELKDALSIDGFIKK